MGCELGFFYIYFFICIFDVYVCRIFLVAWRGKQQQSAANKKKTKRKRAWTAVASAATTSAPLSGLAPKGKLETGRLIAWNLAC